MKGVQNFCSSLALALPNAFSGKNARKNCQGGRVKNLAHENHVFGEESDFWSRNSALGTLVPTLASSQEGVSEGCGGNPAPLLHSVLSDADLPLQLGIALLEMPSVGPCPVAARPCGSQSPALVPHRAEQPAVALVLAAGRRQHHIG